MYSLLYLRQSIGKNFERVLHILIIQDGEIPLSLDAFVKKLYQRIHLFLCHRSFRGDLCKLKILSCPKRCPWLRFRCRVCVWGRLPVPVGFKDFSSAGTVQMIFIPDVVVLVALGWATTIICGTGVRGVTAVVRRCRERLTGQSKHPKLMGLNGCILACRLLTIGQCEHRFPIEQ